MELIGYFVLHTLLIMIEFVFSIALVVAIILGALRYRHAKSLWYKPDTDAFQGTAQYSTQRLQTRNWLSIVRVLPFGLFIGLSANYMAFRGSLFLLHILPGTTIRPMFEGAYAGLASLLALIIGFPLCWLELRKGIRAGHKLIMVLSIAGMLLILASWPFGDFCWDYFATQRHITFEQ